MHVLPQLHFFNIILPSSLPAQAGVPRPSAQQVEEALASANIGRGGFTAFAYDAVREYSKSWGCAPGLR